jgi:hypothetical protein
MRRAQLVVVHVPSGRVVARSSSRPLLSGYLADCTAPAGVLALVAQGEDPPSADLPPAGKPHDAV